MKRIKYIIIMAAVLVTAVCFMIIFSRKNQAVKPDQVPEASFVFADKAESEGDYSYIVQQDTSGGALFGIYRTDSNGVAKVYEKQFSHPTIFWKYGARVYIIQDIHEKKQIRTTVYEVSDPQKPVEEQTYEQQGSLMGTNLSGEYLWVVTKQKDKPSAVSLYLGCRTRYRLYAARWQLKEPKNSPKTKEDIVNGAKALQKNKWYQQVQGSDHTLVPYDRDLNLQVNIDFGKEVTLRMRSDSGKQQSKVYPQNRPQENVIVDNRRGYIGLCVWNPEKSTYRYVLLNYNAAIGFKEVWHSEQYETPVLGQIRANELYLFAHGTGKIQELPL